jgi:hypothetical protein
LLAAPSIVRAQGRNGVALVIGNSKYQWEASLPNVKRDVTDMARTFEAMGLKTELVHDAGLDTMREAIARLGAAARGVELAFFYFAGHGVTLSAGDIAWLVPADADLTVPKTDGLVYSQEAVKATVVARTGINMFDNCRNNPADGWKQKAVQDAFVSRSSQNALKKIIGPRLNLWSTCAGHVALDGPPGQNSPFAAAVLRQLDGDALDTSTLPARVRRDLIVATEGRQVLQDFNAFDQPQSFKGAHLGPRAGGSGVDAARIVELPNAFGFAGSNGIYLPPGLVALRPRGNSRYGQMIGSYKFVQKVNGEPKPLLLLVLSADESGIAEVVLGTTGGGGGYRFFEAKVSEGRLDYVLRAGGNHTVFDWRNANGGSFSILTDGIIAPYATANAGSFTRLDG